MIIKLIIGLPGSGKTWLANSFDGIIIDDIVSIDQLPGSADTLIITDVNFCDAKILSKAVDQLTQKYDGLKFEYYYFENDPDACRANVKFRNDGRFVEGTILRFAPIYKPPVDALRIWRGS